MKVCVHVGIFGSSQFTQAISENVLFATTPFENSNLNFRSKRISGNVSLLSFSNDGLVQNQNVILAFIAIYFGLVTFIDLLKAEQLFSSFFCTRILMPFGVAAASLLMLEKMQSICSFSTSASVFLKGNGRDKSLLTRARVVDKVS